MKRRFWTAFLFILFFSFLRISGHAGAALPDQQDILRPHAAGAWGLPESLSTQAPAIDHLLYALLLLTGAVFLGVQGMLVFFLFRYRRRQGVPAAYEPGSPLLEALWAFFLVLIFLGIAFWGQKVWKGVKASMPPGTGDVTIRIQAEQYAWNMQYPGPDGRFDTADDLKFVNQLHIPAHRKIRLTLSSIAREGKPAVVHSFFVPEFRIKQDVVPGLAIDVVFEATNTGRYEIACAEFCGLGHYRMRGFLTIHSPAGYEAWLAEEEKAQHA